MKKHTFNSFIKYTLSTFFVAALFSIASCSIGLGEAVDLNGPTVDIIYPLTRENVKDKFTISGTVEDDFNIGLVTVTVGESEWKNENGVWFYRATSQDEFAVYENATWNVSENEKSVTWEIKDASATGQGVFTIKVSAQDKAQNKSEQSTKSRDIIVDGQSPVVTISAPQLSADSTTYDIENYKDITKLNRFLTGNFTISGNAKDDNSIESVDLYIMDAETAEVYYQKRITLEDVDSLRSWEIPVTLDECELKKLDENKHVLKLYTNSLDAAGNTNDDLVLQGYTCLWKAANKPWIEMKSLEISSASSPLSVYSGSPIQGAAYDDYAIAKITTTVKTYDANSNTVGSAVSSFNNKVVYEAGSEDENNVLFELEVPTACEIFYVELSAVDKNENVSDVVKGFIKVEDKTFPSIDVSYSVNGATKETNDTLFGDANGTFNFDIIAKDDTAIKSAKVAYIVDKNDLVNYANKADAIWEDVCENISDLKNKKVLNIKLTNTNETETLDGITRKKFKGSIPVNIFTDLGIDGDNAPLSSQTFVFRIEDTNGNALTKTYTFQGDIEPPTIEFSKIEYYADGVTLKKEITSQDELLDTFGLYTKVTVFGKITDNSSSAWGNYKSLYSSGKLKLSLTANDKTITPEVNEDGTFKADVTDLINAPSLYFIGKVTDYAASTSESKYSFLVDTTQPRVDYISSTNSNGCYKKKDTINIYIKFNKLFTLKDYTSAPTLTLNNYGTATMQSQFEKTNVFTFEYTVADGEDIEKLNVTGINLNGAKIIDPSKGDDTHIQILADQLSDLTKKSNLSEKKDICIITKVPELQSAELDEERGILTLTYDKKVAKGSGNLNVTITQENVTKVPAVLSKSEYDTLAAKTADKTKGFKDYYKEGTNGADKNFKFDTSTKYILNYDISSDNSELVSLYTSIDAHKLTQNVKSNKVTLSSDKKSVTISFDVNKESGSCLPCKGATYSISIDKGFVQDEKGGENFPVVAYAKTGWKTAAGIELPVIRIKTGKGEFDSTTLTTTQPLTSEFKIDCETPDTAYDRIGFSYTPKTRGALNVSGAYDKADNIKATNDYNAKAPTTGTEKSKPYSTAVEIGSDDYKKGEIYEITATVYNSSNEKIAESYNAAYRTTIVAKGMQTKINDRVTNRKDNGTAHANNFAGTTACWLSGGDNIVGPSTTPGFPLTWDATKAALMTQGKITTGTNKDNTDWYYVTWDINGDENTRCYVGLLAGVVDADSATKGPAKYIYTQNGYITAKKNYGIVPGGYLILNASDIDFEINVNEKIVTPIR